ncbi:hypothetical protein ABZU42_00335 [Micromonospora profundi]|uniref:hypothetical protein n=1 Tax=Micromonospora profundi TaxID=1420889 RepID=UPI0033AC9F13
MRLSSLAALLVLGVAAATLPACASNTPAPPAASPSDMPEGLVTGDQGVAPTGRDGLGGPGASASSKPAAKPLAAGNPNGKATVPAEARAVDTSKPTRTVGTGTPASCTSAAVVKAVAAGGVIAFDCGPAPATIKMTATAKVRNANGPKVVLDGGGRVTLSGQGKRRILYMNTCDEAQGWTTSHCQNQDHPQLTVQNLTFADGNSTGDRAEGGGGGAIFVRGANPAKSGTPGGGSGGSIYCDGNEFTVRIAGTIIENNKANEGGGAIFFVSNNRTGTMKIENSTLRRNPSGKFETSGYPGIFFLGARNPTVTGSKLT